MGYGSGLGGRRHSSCQGYAPVGQSESGELDSHTPSVHAPLLGCSGVLDGAPEVSPTWMLPFPSGTREQQAPGE